MRNTPGKARKVINGPWYGRVRVRDSGQDRTKCRRDARRYNSRLAQKLGGNPGFPSSFWAGDGPFERVPAFKCRPMYKLTSSRPNVILSWRYLNFRESMHIRRELLNAYVNLITKDDIIQFIRRKYTRPTNCSPPNQ